MKRIRFILIFTILSAIVTSCSVNSENFDAIAITPTLIGKGNLYGNGEENISQQNLVIKNIDSWNQLAEQLNTRNNITDNFTGIDIDFSKQTVIAIFDDIKTSGGHTIDITSIIEFEATIFVKIENLQTGNLTTVITQPYHIVKIPKSDKSIVFD